MLLSSCTTRQSTWSIVYKALHVPKQMTQENVEGVTECLRVHHHFDSVQCYLKCCALKLFKVMFGMALYTLPNLSSESTSTIPIPLATEYHGGPYNLHDTTKSNAKRYPSSTLRAKIWSRDWSNRGDDARLGQRFKKGLIQLPCGVGRSCKEFITWNDEAAFLL